ncbi:unnamed protein product [Boreogadus saida]
MAVPVMFTSTNDRRCCYVWKEGAGGRGGAVSLLLQDLNQQHSCDRRTEQNDTATRDPRPPETTRMADNSSALPYQSSSELLVNCDALVYEKLWTYIQVLMLFVGLAANLPLAWLFIKEHKNLSPAKVVGVNLLVMQLLYIFVAPFGIAIRVFRENDTLVNDNYSSRAVEEGAYILVVTGCPMLLAVMCVERYAAVARPLVYLRARKWGYKIAVTAAVWTVTLIFSLTTVYTGLETIALPMSVLVCVLLVVMLYCLVGLAWSLGQQGPAHSGALPQKRRALKNVLLVIVPAVFAYLPVCFLPPLLTFSRGVDRVWCNVLEAIFSFPYIGVCIGPMFYRAKFKQVLCGRGGGASGGR